jgi:hypothetical protein
MKGPILPGEDLTTVRNIPTRTKTMTTEEGREFVNFLFDKLFAHVDTDMLDLHDDDSCCDHVMFKQLELI